MPKITRHGGSSNRYEIESAPEESLGELPEVTKLSIPVGVGIGIEEDRSSVGNNSSLSSNPTLTIEELLKGNLP